MIEYLTETNYLLTEKHLVRSLGDEDLQCKCLASREGSLGLVFLWAPDTFLKGVVHYEPRPSIIARVKVQNMIRPIQEVHIKSRENVLE